MQIETDVQLADPISVSGYKIYPAARITRLHWSKEAGLIWSRPQSVLVQSPDGSEQILAVRDRTREIQLLFFSLAILGAIASWLSRNSKTGGK